MQQNSLESVMPSYMHEHMLNDIFARRYEGMHLVDSLGQAETKLLVQCFRILAEDIYPYYVDGKKSPIAAEFWTDLHSKLSRELGLKQLSSLYFSRTLGRQGSQRTENFAHTLVQVCENWMFEESFGDHNEHTKERLSLIELGFRLKEQSLDKMNTRPISDKEKLLSALAQNRLTPKTIDTDFAIQYRANQNRQFQTCVEELNARFRQAELPLHYHRGFIQILTDDLVQQEIENPFWELLSSSDDWQNVEIDMKQALDRRDSNERDASFYAARALESTIKIICKKKSLVTGRENGAANFIDALGSKANGIILGWEREALKHFFKEVRNPFGHGPGDADMPTLTNEQTEWAIEHCMSWIKSLVNRI